MCCIAGLDHCRQYACEGQSTNTPAGVISVVRAGCLHMAYMRYLSYKFSSCLTRLPHQQHWMGQLTYMTYTSLAVFPPHRVASARHAASCGRSYMKADVALLVRGVTLYLVLDTKVAERTSNCHVTAHLSRQPSYRGLCPSNHSRHADQRCSEATKVPYCRRGGCRGLRTCTQNSTTVVAGQRGSFYLLHQPCWQNM
jgi:hypothetical protein